MKVEILEDKSEKWIFDVEHVSMDPDFKELPLRSFILKSCNDGVSSLALENDQDVLLLVSNVDLVTSKVKQYVNTQFEDVPEKNYPARERFGGEVFGVWKGVKSSDVQNYIDRCRVAGTPVKLMSVYDSLFKFVDLLDNFDVIAVDEADMLQDYSQLKSMSRKKTDMCDAITRVYEMAEENQDRVVFFSATTMGEAYLPDWVNSFRKIQLVTPNIVPPLPILMKRNQPINALKREIILNIVQNGSVTIGPATFSRCIVFLNSVQNILRIIRECNLSTSQVGIVCGDSNRNKLQTLGLNTDVDLDNIPQFLFVTSSGWRGLDIHDKGAMSIVVSSTSKSYHQVSVDTQLIQCVRRQRDKENPNYGQFVFVYNTSTFDHSEEELLKAWKEKRQRYESNIQLLNEKLEAGDDEAYQYALKTFNHDKGFIRYVNFEQGKGLVINENLFKTVLHRILVVRRSYTEDSTDPVEGMFQVRPVVIPAPKGSDPSSFTTLLNLFRKQNKTKEDQFTDEQKNSDNYKIIAKYLDIYGKLPARLNTAKLKLAYAADNMPAQYQIDMVSPFLKKLGKRIPAKTIEQHMKTLFRQYGLDSATDMPTLISALAENGVELVKRKSSQAYYEVLSIPTIESLPVKTSN